MSKKYRCPQCKTNRTRFNLLEQVPHPVKLDPQTGDIIQEYSNGQTEPFHITYNGPDIRVQCAACGLIDSAQTFEAYGSME
ncbi:DNA alkylation repair protein [Bacillus sp. 1P06AnD]|uniref:DNA alkylation repair protein n=1 Tax=Bacillus sp. 1P06AnD TaxID=3132208 RepID=UPI0039A1E9A8